MYCFFLRKLLYCLGMPGQPLRPAGWCSILVGKTTSEGGAKNPSKGTSMKLLVLAADAQLGVGAGSKGRRAIRNGMWALTQLPWRPKRGGLDQTSSTPWD